MATDTQENEFKPINSFNNFRFYFDAKLTEAIIKHKPEYVMVFSQMQQNKNNEVAVEVFAQLYDKNDKIIPDPIRGCPCPPCTGPGNLNNENS